jgi:hypothetical protein
MTANFRSFSVYSPLVCCQSVFHVSLRSLVMPSFFWSRYYFEEKCVFASLDESKCLKVVNFQLLNTSFKSSTRPILKAITIWKLILYNYSFNKLPSTTNTRWKCLGRLTADHSSDFFLPSGATTNFSRPDSPSNFRPRMCY